MDTTGLTKFGTFILYNTYSKNTDIIHIVVIRIFYKIKKMRVPMY